VQQFLRNLQALGDVEYEIVLLRDYRLEPCRGCLSCFERGEECCPVKDDRDVLIGKIETSDGVVFASSNYSFHSTRLGALKQAAGSLFDSIARGMAKKKENQPA
jgi:multimeric flavodoxin WrbA